MDIPQEIFSRFQSSLEGILSEDNIAIWDAEYEWYDLCSEVLSTYVNNNAMNGYEFRKKYITYSFSEESEELQHEFYPPEEEDYDDGISFRVKTILHHLSAIYMYRYVFDVYRTKKYVPYRQGIINITELNRVQPQDEIEEKLLSLIRTETSDLKEIVYSLDPQNSDVEEDCVRFLAEDIPRHRRNSQAYINLVGGITSFYPPFLRISNEELYRNVNSGGIHQHYIHELFLNFLRKKSESIQIRNLARGALTRLQRQAVDNIAPYNDVGTHIKKYI